MLPKNWIARKIGHALSVWAGSTTIFISYAAHHSVDTVFFRSIIGFVSFGLLGYAGGWLIEQSMKPELSFIYKDDRRYSASSSNLPNDIGQN